MEKMYMRNNRSRYYDRQSKYNISDFPPNYSGQYTKDSLKNDADKIIEVNLHDGEEKSKSGSNKESERRDSPEHEPPSEYHEHKDHRRPNAGNRDAKELKEIKEIKEEKKANPHSLIGGLLNGNKSGGGGILSKIFGENDGKGILGGIELEDLILLAVVFFLLKDGVEDDFLIILALILLA